MTRQTQERRQHPRAVTRVLIRYRDAEQFFTDYILNISRGGIFVATPDPLPVGTPLHIGFALPDCDRLIATEGVIVRSTLDDPDASSDTSGMGIQFRRLDEEALDIIDNYVNKHLT
jgi:type IV pilus assembly protein PilZ